MTWSISRPRDQYPTDLSTGYRRAVAIARALAAQPQCILYDEPTTMVDPIMSDISATDAPAKKALKLTSVVVTHDLELMRKVADNVVFLFEGKVIYFGAVSELEEVASPAYSGVPGRGSGGIGSVGYFPALS